ncbi:hypothetical protein Tco_1389960, partial [Tanacetum coccineum]
ISEEIKKAPEKRLAVKAHKKRNLTVSSSVFVSILIHEKKADSSTEQLLLTLMNKDRYKKPKCSTCGSIDHLSKEHPEQVVVKKTSAKLKAQSTQGSSSRKAPMIPKPFNDCKYYGFNAHHSDEFEYYLRCDICGSIAHETIDCTKKLMCHCV